MAPEHARVQQGTPGLDIVLEVTVELHKPSEEPMALNIKNEEAHRLARALAEETGETLTEAVTVAIRERLESLRRKHRRTEVVRSVQDIQEFVQTLPDLDRRSAEEILGYDEFGLPQ